MEVIELYCPQVLEFESINDFNIYYNKYADDFNDMTTQKLNTKYKIPAYPLTKEKGQRTIIVPFIQKSDIPITRFLQHISYEGYK